jgi:hypothetical protein
VTLRWIGQDQDPSELLARLPPCYSNEFDLCVGDFQAKKPVGELSSYCTKYYDLFQNTSDMVWNAAIDSMPYCSPGEQKPARSLFFPIAGAGLVGLLLGTLVR